MAPGRWACLGLLLGLIALGCGDDKAADDTPDSATKPEPDAKTPPDPTWVHQTLGAGDVGLFPNLAVSDEGKIGLAYFATRPVEGDLCTELNSQDPPVKLTWRLYFTFADATLPGQGDWKTESVRDILGLSDPNGLSFQWGPDGLAYVAAMTGEPVVATSFCAANDVGFLKRNGADDWSLTAAVSTSGEAAIGEPGSDYGDVVGYWPALGFDSTGAPWIAYKDVHSGALQSDDRKRADLEIAHGAGGWTALPVDMGRGAGDYNSIAIDAQDRPVIAYYNPVESKAGPQVGVWVARRISDGTFELVQLFNKGTTNGPSVQIHPEDDLPRVLFYNSTHGYPQLSTQVSEAEFGSISQGWDKVDIGDARYDEGYNASLAIARDGQMAAAYYRCAKVVSGLGECTPQEDALIFAYEDAGEWIHEIVDAGGDGLCGRHPSLSFDADGYAHIAYECEELVDGRLQTQIRYARRKPL